MPSAAELAGYKRRRINIVGPPLFALLDTNAAGRLVSSSYANRAKAAGLDIIAWSLEHSGILATPDIDWYYQTVDASLQREGDVMKVLDVLGREIGVRGVFSDWPATVTYYANCVGLE